MNSRWRTFIVRAVVCVACALSSHPVEAQSSPVLPDDRSGKALQIAKNADVLMTQSKYQEACTLYREAQNLEPTAGGLCDIANACELLGQVSTAWQFWISCLNEEQKIVDTTLNRDRRKKAEQRVREVRSHADELEKRRPTLKIILEDRARLPGLTVKVNNEEWGTARWYNEWPLDPGDVTVTAEAPGRRPWSTTVHFDLKKEGEPPEKREVNVPELETLPPPKPTASPPSMPPKPPPDQSFPRRPILASVSGGVTLGAVVLGVAFIGMAFSKMGEAVQKCGVKEARYCSQADAIRTGADPLRNDALSLADAATVSFGIAGVALGFTGYFLFLASPSRSSPIILEVTPVVGPADASLSVRGRF